MQISRRINIVGTSGAGKTTFGRKLASRLDLPYVEMDKIFWEPNWTQPTDEMFFERLKSALSQDGWILDGNYTRSIPIKWERAELVVWLDYSFSRTLYRAVKRAIKRSITQEELWEGTGNRESFRKSFFSKESIIWWTITTHKRSRQRYERYLDDPLFSHIKFIRLRNPSEADRFLLQF